MAKRVSKPSLKETDPEEFERRKQAYHEQLARDPGSDFWLWSHSITTEQLAKEIKDHLKATQQKVFYDARNERVVYSDELIDWATRGRALELAVKLLGMAPERVIHSGDKDNPVRLDVSVRLDPNIEEFRRLMGESGDGEKP